MRSSRLSRTLCFVIGLVPFLVLVPALHADAIMRTQAMLATTIVEYFIDERGVRVEMEIGLEDLQAFQNLLPDELYTRLGHPPKPLIERIPIFFQDDFMLAVEDGDSSFGRVLQMEPRDRIRRDEISGEPLPLGQDEQAETVIFVELFFPFVSLPSRLTIGRSHSLETADIGFVVYHEGLPVNDFRYLGQNYELKLDWDDPWFSAFESRSLRRTYYSPMTGFIYVEPYEVRKEIIVRPQDLQQWVDLGLDGLQTIPVELQPELKRRVAEFLRQHQKVKIDGQEIAPELARINFLRRTLRSSVVIDPPEPLGLVSATLGAIFVYPTEGLPDRVTMQWDLFDERSETVPVAAVDQAGPLGTMVTTESPVLEWQNFLQNPTLPTLIVNESPPSRVERVLGWLRWVLFFAVALAVVQVYRGRQQDGVYSPSVVSIAVGLGLLALAAFWFGRGVDLDEERSHELVTGLLHNVYRAFDFRGEERIYDLLERSVDGDLLTTIYLETQRGLELRNQGGARAKVKHVELIDLETTPGPNGGFVANVTWNVAGSIGHWGHIHSRTNQYRANLGIQPVDGEWKLTDLELIEETRL